MLLEGFPMSSKTLFITIILVISISTAAQTAPGAPGSIPTWTPGSKDAVGTATSTDSKVWFTLQGGILTEVYYPRLDTADVRSLEFAVSDGKTVWIESRDMIHSIARIDENSLSYRQTSTDPGGHFQIDKIYATDPHHDTLLIDVGFSGSPSYSLYVLYDPALNNFGYGDTGSTQNDVLLAEKSGVASALLSSTGLTQMTNGFAGVSDAYTDLLLHRQFTWSYARAENGNIIQAAKLAGSHLTLALAFGATATAAVASARASLQSGFPAINADYAKGWHDYARTLRPVNDQRYARQFRLAAMTLKAHEDKTFRGAMIASMSIPWGFAVNADAPGVGGYHLVWARDLYEIATAMLIAGDRPAADRALDYLFNVQQKPDGSFPQNSWLDGKPYWTALQMDENAYPIILAWQLNRNDANTWLHHIRPEAEFILAKGPATQQERWEETPGYSPSTIAAEIAGLVCAADIARNNNATADADRYLKTADNWAANLENWMVTTTGHLGGPQAAKGYYIRIDNNTDPNDGYQLDVRNGGGTWDERDIVDAGFLELVRLGIRPPDDPNIDRSVAVIDATIRVETPAGPSFHRYNHDGYGEPLFGGAWLGHGIGRIWPIFTGERGEYEVARGRDASTYLDAMANFANDGGMIPEQIWDEADPTQSHFVFGAGTGSATPLAWSMAQFIRLVAAVEAQRIVEQPSIVATHFLKKK
jgi:glucoamylase